jgi:pimeloyl-ACP methyl ester carboxylesterase
VWVDQFEEIDGLRLALRHLQDGRPPAVLYVHGTSFHALVLAPLAKGCGSFEAVGLDLRGHGASSPVAAETFEWSSLGDDVGCALSALEERDPGPILGVGHSAGATALLLAAARWPARLSRLSCYEPIALNDAIREQVALPAPLSGAARRRAHFSSREEALAHFSGRPPLSGLDPSVLQAYVEGGLVKDGEGGVRLACDPEFEAAVYRAGYESDVYDEIREVQCPVTVAFGGADEGIGAACAPVVAGALRHCELVRLEGLGHLGPLENPRAVADSIITAFDTPGT